MTAAVADAQAALNGAARLIGGVLLVGAGVVALAFAAAAALVVALIVAGAAIALRFAPKPRPDDHILDAHETPAGWVVETRTSRPS